MNACRLLTVVTFAFTVALAGPALAAEAAAPPAAARNLAKLLMTEQTYSAMLDSYAAGMAEQLRTMLTHGKAEVPKDLQAKIRAELGKGLSYADVTELQAAGLAKRFTPDELQTLGGFYSGPLGQKMLKEFPAFASDVDRQIRQKLDAKGTAVFDQYVPKKPAPRVTAGAPGAKKPASSAGATPVKK
jgi:hypothetical protein